MTNNATTDVLSVLEQILMYGDQLVQKFMPQQGDTMLIRMSNEERTAAVEEYMQMIDGLKTTIDMEKESDPNEFIGQGKGTS